MSGPSVVVDWAPEGWTHIGGPGMHLLIGLDEDDEQTLVASDAADGGDLDDVLEVLTAGGMRKARHFVGVHWRPRTRLVAFGPVAAMVTLADGSEHEVRATSTRVWTDVELPEHPAHVRLRVLDEAEAAEVPPPVSLGAAAGSAPAGSPHPPVPEQTYAVGAPTAPTGPMAATAANGGPSVEQSPSAEPAAVAPAGVERAGVEKPDPEPAEALAEPAAQQDAPGSAQGPVAVVPTFGGSATTVSRTTSPWQRSWAQHSPSSVSAGSTPAATPNPVVEPPTPEPVAPEPVAPGPVESMPGASNAPQPVDVESTLSARPVPDPPQPSLPDPPAAALPDPVVETTDGIMDSTDSTDRTDPGAPGAGGEEAPPSYDYLFGHTTTVDEHRRVLAELERPGDDEHDDHDDELPAEQADGGDTGAAAASASLETGPAAAQGRPTGPSGPASSGAVSPEEGGLISSVPWARPAATAAPGAPTSPTGPTVPADPGPPPEVPTFAGRHTPPPAPSLLPPAIAVPPGVRAAPTAPIITTGPPPAMAAVTPPPPAEVVTDDEAELTVDRRALMQAREAARSQVSSGPSVLAVLCSSGHPTPPHGERCRVCGSGIPPQESFAMPRPPLGVLRLSTGDVVTLDRSVLLGRAPRLSESHSAADRPHVVKVPSPERDVSRNHVEVVLEGWHVLIRDLGTTNGTTVSLPGETAVRLPANDQQVLEPGSVVSMADEISFVFETAN